MDVTAKRAVKRVKTRTASAKDKLNLLFNAYVERTFFHPKSARFHHQSAKSKKWIALGKELFRDFLLADGYFKGFLDDAKNSEKTEAQIKNNSWQKLVHAVVTTKSIDWMGELAGIPEGLYRDNGYRCLITGGPVYVEPRAGNCPFIEKFMEELFPGEQVHVMEALIARMYRLKRDPDAVFICQIPIMVGERDCGKSLFKDEIFIPLLGGRSGDAISFITGGTFNSELARADVWVIDDQGFDTRFDLDVTADRLKKFAADRNKRIEKKYEPAINVHIKPCMLILLNTESKNLRLLPERTGDIEDKLLGFLCGKATLPKGEEHEKVIRDTIAKQLPAYLHKILHKKAPKGIISPGRFGIVPFYHLELLAMREAEDNAISILDLIEDYVELNSLGARWTRTAGKLFAELTSEGSTRIACLSLCKNPKALGWQLHKLSRMRPEAVIRQKCGKYGYEYTFCFEMKPAGGEGRVGFE